MSASRIMALDPGTKRIGVALSDEMGWFAQPLETFERRSLDADVAHIAELIQRHDVNRIVMGMPIRLDGTLGPAAAQAQAFIARLEQSLSVPIVAWDERLTTKAAEDVLIQANVSRRKRKGTVDRVAAAILLQSYLESLASEAEASRRQGNAPPDGDPDAPDAAADAS
jgi:putative holliday junction resolvase